MRITKYVVLSVFTLLVLVAAACSRQTTAVDPAKLRMFAPLPELVPAKAGPPTEEQVTLGRMLYYDPRLSRSQTISCNSCHQLAAYGVDGKPTSEGHKQQHGDRNSPSVYNAAGHMAQFWDGRAADLEEQAKGPMLNPVEMAMPSDQAVVKVLNSMPGYVTAFRKAFPGEKDPITFDNAANAIGAFERKLLTPARWDKFLRGDETALTPEEKVGFNTFASAGCSSCHAGALLGGNLYQKLGVMKPYPDAADPGRYKVTQNEADRMLFKVPSLRNTEKTGPYFHNGKVPTLEQAVVQMADYQLGKSLSEPEVRSIVAWMKTLTGDIPADYIKEPVLPKSTSRTPKPVTAD